MTGLVMVPPVLENLTKSSMGNSRDWDFNPHFK